MMNQSWLHIPYVEFGRDESGADCWGLVRIARKFLRGDDLDSYAKINPQDKIALTKAANLEIKEKRFFDCQPKIGAIATVWRNLICCHVGIVVIVDNRLHILDTTYKVGPRLRLVADFERRYSKVVYFDNDN